MSSLLSARMRALFAPPEYIAFPFAGIDLSASGVKAVRLTEGVDGLTLDRYAEAQIEPGAFSEGEIVNRQVVVEALKRAADATGITSANIALPESKSYLFETTVEGSGPADWRTGVEQHLDEFIPLPPAEAIFDMVDVGKTKTGGTIVAGIGFARRIAENTLSAFEDAGIQTRVLEGEMFAPPRALLAKQDTDTVLVVDIGKTTTKLTVVTRRIPRFATTIHIGGHGFTLAVQKYFGVTEAEARKVKADRGIVPAPGNEVYRQAMLETVSAIRDELARHLTYWQTHAKTNAQHEPVSRAVIIGGNASVRGLPEYLEGSLGIPVSAGDVFTNFASRDVWIPELDYRESLAYATAIGLALRDKES